MNDLLDFRRMAMSQVIHGTTEDADELHHANLHVDSNGEEGVMPVWKNLLPMGSVQE
jgi:hypothetical protein